MKKGQKIGIVGGLSPESTVTYYLSITRGYSAVMGGSTFPEIVIYSVNLEDYHLFRNQGRWDWIADDLVKAVRYLEACDVDVVIIATNTMHKVFAEVQSRTSVKLLSIIDATVAEVKASGLRTVGLLGTRFTMTDRFFSDVLQNQGISVLVPPHDDVELIHRIIEEELVKGVFSDESRAEYVRIIDDLVVRGVEGVILGCTEIPLLIKQTDVAVPIFDTAAIHSDAVLRYVLAQ